MSTMIGSGEATREEIAEAIADLKRQHDRLPVHWEDRRKVLMDEIDCLVDDWLEADG